MNGKVKILTPLYDWSLDRKKEIPVGVRASRSMDSTTTSDMGLYIDGKGYRTSGIIGIGWLRNNNGTIYKNTSTGEKLAVRILPRFDLEPWTMLAKVMADPEYDSYIEALGESLYEIFWKEEMIEAPAEEKGGELLLAISFLKSCESICKKHVKSKMDFNEGNLTGKLLGSLMVSKHIKQNIFQGREDRLYCQYPVFTVDTLENRILKSALAKVEKIIRENNFISKEIQAMCSYCRTALKSVKTVRVCNGDFSKVNVTGFNSYYRQSIDYAKILLTQSGLNELSLDEGVSKKKIIPYAIRMESLFEFYVRSCLKEHMKKNRADFENIVLDEYRTPRINPLVTLKSNSESAYLMKNYIPDIAFKEKCIDDSGNTLYRYIAVFDVKYQNYLQSAYMGARRHNSHQLLFYTLLLNVNKCGFIFPQFRDVEENENTPYELLLQNGNANNLEGRTYTQWNYSEKNGNRDLMISALLKYIAS